MATKILSISLKPELTTGTTDFLLGQIFAKIVATITVAAEWEVKGNVVDSEDEIDFYAPNKIISRGKNFKSEEFFVGDQIVISGTASNNGTRTIQSFEDDGATIITVENLQVDESTVYSAVVTGDMEIKGCNFKYNLIENSDSENYDSKVDQNEAKFAKGDLNYAVTTDVDMVAEGVYKSNQIGGAKIKGSGTPNEFVITHTFYVTPFFLKDQLADLLAGKTPEYFLDLSCLKYIYHVDLLYSINDPNRVHPSNDESFLLGNTGWFNENFNAGIPKFYIDRIVFQRVSNSQVIDFVDFDSPTNVFIVVKSVDGVFSNNNTKFVLNHIVLPEEEEQYIDTATDMTKNFMFDRGKQTVGSAVVDGDNFGTSKQVLKQINGTFVSANEILVSAVIDLSSEYSLRVQDLTDRQLLLSVTVQDHTKDSEEADIVATLKGVNTYDTDLSNDGIGNIQTSFNPYPDISRESSSAGNFPEDILRGNSIIGVDTVNGALVKDMSIIIKAENGSKSFVLEQKDFSFSGAVVQSGVQQINIVQPAGFTLKSDNPFYNLSLVRRSDLDAGTVKKYQIIYPFKIRWEDFIQLGNVDPDFYDVLEKFNGSNQEWPRYFHQAGWSISYVVRARIEENGVINSVSNSSNVLAYNYDEATDWSQSIKVYDIATSAEIPSNILSDKIVRVKAIFTKLSGSLPALADVFGIIEYEPFEQGGRDKIRNINSGYEHETSSPFISTLGTKLLEATKVSNVYTFIADIDGSLLTGRPKLSARIYDLTVPPFGSSKDFQDGGDFDFQDSDPYDFQDA